MDSGRAERIDPTLIMRRLPGWLAGGGLFTLHAGAYLLVAFSLLVWNLIQSPADLGVPAPRLIIPWGVLVLIHAAVVAVFSVLHDVFAPEEEPPVSPPVAPYQPPAPAIPTAQGKHDEPPAQRVARFRPAATTLADVRGEVGSDQQVSWRNPVRSLRQAAATLRHDDATEHRGQNGWHGESSRPMTEEEQRAVGNQQLERWRGGRASPENGRAQGQGGSAAPAPRRVADGQSGVVRPIATDSAEFDETEWRWLEAAATSHLAQRGPETGKDGKRQAAAPVDGDGADTGAQSGGTSSP